MTPSLLRFTFISLLLLIYSPAISQSVEEAYHHSIQLYDKDEYEQADIEFQRVALFSDSLRKDCYNYLAKCCFKSGKTEEGLDYIHRSRKLEQNDSIKQELTFQIIHTYLVEGSPINALLEIADKPGASSYFERKRLFYLVITHFLLGNYDESEYHLETLSVDFPYPDSLLVTKLYRKANNIKHSNTWIYQALSAAIPGAGQLAAGNFRQGFNSFTLNAILITAAIVTYSRLSFLDAFLTFFPAVKRYYSSSILLAKSAADKRKETIKALLYNSLLDYIDSQMNGYSGNRNPGIF